MSRLVIRHRPDGVIQLRRRPLWHLLADRAAGAMLLLFAAVLLLLTGVATALVVAPFALVLLGGCGVLGLVAARWAWTEQLAPARAPRDEPPRPPLRVA
jgi:hypothetical protein